MNHAELQEALPEYLAARLAEPARRAVEEHLADCDKCADLVASWDVIAPELRERGAAIFQPHPEPSRLRRMARGEGAIDREATEHVSSCPSCALEVAAWRDATLGGSGRSAAAPRARTGARPGASWGVAAALAAVALLAGASFVFTIDRFVAPHGTPEESATWTGPLSLVLLGDGMRGTAPSPLVRTTAGRPYVLLGAQFALPADLAAETSLIVRIADASGRPVWETQCSAGDARTDLETTGAVPLLVPARRLGPGVFSVEIASGRGARPLLLSRFEVQADR